MKCFRPIDAWQMDDGEIRFTERGGGRPLQLRCGQCHGCRLRRARDWSVRCVHESRMHERNSFVTLTYSDEHVPKDGSLRYSDVQKFFKRLRKQQPCRFVVAGEYGSANNRPHYHALLFGVDFEDRKEFSRAQGKSPLYTSKRLSALWTHGFSSVGEVSSASASYVAKYSLKKVTGQRAYEHYRRVDTETGEIYWILPEFLRCSLKPAIGYPWFEKYGRQIWTKDKVVLNGRAVSPPRVYFQWLERTDADLSEFISYSRYLESAKLSDDGYPLEYQEFAVKARSEFYSNRSL